MLLCVELNLTTVSSGCCKSAWISSRTKTVVMAIVTAIVATETIVVTMTAVTTVTETTAVSEMMAIAVVVAHPPDE